MVPVPSPHYPVPALSPLREATPPAFHIYHSPEVRYSMQSRRSWDECCGGGLPCPPDWSGL
jgi:hypothetical protein